MFEHCIEGKEMLHVKNKSQKKLLIFRSKHHFFKGGGTGAP